MQRTSTIPYSNISAASGLVDHTSCPLPHHSTTSDPQVSWQLWASVLLPPGDSPNLDKVEEEQHFWLFQRIVL